MIKSIEDLLIRHEGLKLKPYRCSAGKLTIGVGHNLEDRGITKEEALYILRNDIVEVVGQLIIVLPWFTKLDKVRYNVMVNMGFNLGVPGLLKFKKFLAAMAVGDYPKASVEMLDSDWAKQVGQRAKELSKMILSGESK